VLSTWVNARCPEASSRGDEQAIALAIDRHVIDAPDDVGKLDRAREHERLRRCRRSPKQSETQRSPSPGTSLEIAKRRC